MGSRGPGRGSAFPAVSMAAGGGRPRRRGGHGGWLLRFWKPPKLKVTEVWGLFFSFSLVSRLPLPRFYGVAHADGLSDPPPYLMVGAAPPEAAPFPPILGAPPSSPPHPRAAPEERGPWGGGGGGIIATGRCLLKLQSSCK